MRTYEILKQANFGRTGEGLMPVRLPHTWNALDGQDGGGDYYRGEGIYEITLPDPTLGKRKYIEFQGANHVAAVWCNGRKLGVHRGGFSTFRFELTDAMMPSGNVLRVAVNQVL